MTDSAITAQKQLLEKVNFLMLAYFASLHEL